MALTTVDTENFSDVEQKFQSLAQVVEGLKTDLDRTCAKAERYWTGEGYEAFKNLTVAVKMEMADISEEFWEAYEALCEAEGLYLEADMDIGTQIESAGASE